MTRLGGVWGWGTMATLLAAGCTRPAPAHDQPVADSSQPAAAQPATAAQADPCASATSQLEINACKATQAKTADSLEALQYDSATRWLKQRNAADRVPLLEASEQAWKAYRDTQCKAEGAGYAGGSLAPTVIADCQARLTQLRTEELKRVYAEPASQ